MQNPQTYYHPDEQNSATCHHTPFTMSLPRPLSTIQPKSSLSTNTETPNRLSIQSIPFLIPYANLKGACCGLLCATSSYVTRSDRENSGTRNKSPRKPIQLDAFQPNSGSGYLTTNLT